MMNLKKIGKLLIVVCILFCFSSNSNAQVYFSKYSRNLEKCSDIGVSLGTATYVGQLSYHGPKFQFGGGLYYRFNHSRWFTPRVDLQYYNINDKEDTYGRFFKTNVFGLSFRNEFNVLQALAPSIFSAYVFVGVGILGSFGTFQWEAEKIDQKYTNITFNIPLGVGIKAFVADKVQIGVEAMTNMALPDNIDNTKTATNKIDFIPYVGVNIGYVIKGHGAYSQKMIKYKSPKYRRPKW